MCVELGSQRREYVGSGAETHVYKSIPVGPFRKWSKESVWSRFDRDSLEPGKVPMSIESQDVAADLDLSNSIGLRIAKSLCKESHQRLIAGSNPLGLAVVRVTRRGVAGKEFLYGPNVDATALRGTDQTRELISARGRSLPRVG